MSNSKFRRPTPREQHILEHLTARPITPQERRRFDALMVEHHYLKSNHLVGEQLCYVATYQGKWLALSSWCAAARHLTSLACAWLGDPLRRKRKMSTRDFLN